jgi:hypothetical protein
MRSRVRRMLRRPAQAVVYGRSQLVQGPQAYAPGHYYSPLPAWDAIDEVRRGVRPALAGVDVDELAQLARLERLAPLVASPPFGPAGRYRYQNNFFSGADAIVLQALLRDAAPRRVVEVGAGWSTAAMLDTFDLVGSDPELVVIEPYPDRLLSLILAGDEDRFELRRVPVQRVYDDVFARLEADDVLFVDSTHVTKSRSDVNRLVFEVLPMLAPGVLVHFHDVCFPFEYPLAWLEIGRGWNEAYLLHAFLQFNDRFEILLWNDFLGGLPPATARLPALAEQRGASLWLRRVR